MNKIYEIYGTDTHEMTKALMKVANIAAGIPHSACSACFASLVRALYIAEEEGLQVKGRIHIGQGYQGKSLEGLGIGRCCMGAERCVTGCPPTASAIVQQFRLNQL